MLTPLPASAQHPWINKLMSLTKQAQRALRLEVLGSQGSLIFSTIEVP